MEFVVVKGADMSGQVRGPLNEADQQQLAQISNLAARLTIYSIPLAAALWVLLSPFPLSPGKFTFELFATTFTPLLLCPVLHEVVHLLAIPTKVFAPKTTVYIRTWGVRSNMAVRIAGPLTREQAVYIALLPFALLTVVPFVLQATGSGLSLGVGLMASVNLGLSAMDILLAIAWLKAFPRNYLLPEI